MSESELLETKVPCNPAAAPPPASAARDELPEDLLQEATQRLGIVALGLGGCRDPIVMKRVISPLLRLQMQA